MNDIDRMDKIARIARFMYVIWYFKRMYVLVQSHLAYGKLFNSENDKV